MKSLLALVIFASPALAVPAISTLTLVNDPIPGQPGKFYSVIDIRLSGPDITTSTTTTTLSGTVEAALDVENSLGETSELTLSNGNIIASDFSLSGNVLLFGFPVGIYNLNATNLAATLFTIIPPGSVTSATGEFAASQHKFSINQGSVTGTAAGQPINETFSPSNPFEGAGSGQGSVTLTPTTSNSLYQNYDITVIVPGVSISDTITAGTTTTVTANATGTVDIKATGTLHVPLTEYLAWTIAQGIPGAPGQGDANHDGLPNALAWAFGLDSTTHASGNRPVVTPTRGFQFELPGLGSAAEIRLQRSTVLSGWVDVPINRISVSSNPLPIGSSGTITVSSSGDTKEFFRLEVSH